MFVIGVDFGSTYTMVSTYDDNNGPETVYIDGNHYSYPSIVVYDEGKKRYYYAAAARTRIGQEHARVYKGFKMLLNSQMGEEELKLRGYDEVHTPEYITKLFLRYVVENTLKKVGETKVDVMVLGAPECWFQSINTVDARESLRNICEGMKDIVETVEIVSEPTCAASFCVWNYERETKRELTGNVLVIDYGGGTLDTALVSVNRLEQGMMIKPEMRSGVGENCNLEIGKAGIAYQEAVVREAISHNLNILQSQIEYNSEFYETVSKFEESLLVFSDDIEEILEEYTMNPKDLEEIEFVTCRYGDYKISINYYSLYQVYQEQIAPVLDNVLSETVGGMTKEQMDNIHIALVGGFCNFYLVKKQIYDFFHIGSVDDRVRGMLKNRADREKAIAHGASVLASRTIEVCNIAQFSIGICAMYNDGTMLRKYAINYGQEIKEDKIYFAEDAKGEPYPMIAENIDSFLLGFSVREVEKDPVHPKEKFIEMLKKVKHSPFVVIGFSLDLSDLITIHIYNYDLEKGMEKEPVESLKLSTLKDMFGTE